MEPPTSFKTEFNDDRLATTVIPSSLTPPPSTQVAVPQGYGRGRLQPSQSQQSNILSLSPPPTGPQPVRECDPGSAYVPPQDVQIEEASEEELRAMLRTCIGEHQRLKMETAHHKLQYNLLSMQSEEDAKRAAVEHDMMRREVDALRMAEHTREARRELSASSESLQSKHLQAKMMLEEAFQENEGLQRRFRVAKKVIQQKEEEIISLADERDMLLNRIRENREHFHILCSPGGMFHGAGVPKQGGGPSTPQHHRTTPRQHSVYQREERGGREYGLSALLQAMSQDEHSVPNTPASPYRPFPRQGSRHSRNAQSLSSLPTTPVSRPRGEHATLLPSADLVPQTEPAQRYRHHRAPAEAGRRASGPKSRESTISVEDTEELARQAVESVSAAASQGSLQSRLRSQRPVGEDGDLYDSRASRAATEMLRRDARQSFEVAEAAAAPGRGGTQGAAEKSAKMQARLLRRPDRGLADDEGEGKRKLSGGSREGEELMRQQDSPTKRARVDTALVGLGIR